MAKQKRRAKQPCFKGMDGYKIAVLYPLERHSENEEVFFTVRVVVENKDNFWDLTYRYDSRNAANKMWKHCNEKPGEKWHISPYPPSIYVRDTNKKVR